MVLPVCAAGSKVIYAGRAENFIFSPGTTESPTNLFPDFQGVMPGDTLTQQILVKNQDKAQVKIYLRSLGAQEASVEFLSLLKLTVKQEGTDMKYEGPADESGKLSDWVCLGTFKSGAEIILNVTLEVPVTMGDEFQSEAGYLDWEFKVEELPSGGNDSQPDDEKEAWQGNPLVNLLAPKTGDNANIMLYGLLLAGAFIVLIVLFRKKRKTDN